MSRDGSVSFRWADGDEHRFRLAIAGLRDIQEATKSSPFTVLARLQSHQPMVEDLREVLRHGLIGGGMKAPEAAKAIERWVDGEPLADSIVPAIAVLAAGLYGPPDEDAGKSPAASEARTPPPEI